MIQPPDKEHDILTAVPSGRTRPSVSRTVLPSSPDGTRTSRRPTPVPQSPSEPRTVMAKRTIV